MPESVALDAVMPDHQHGMNYAPTVTDLGDGRYRFDGLVFHMPGTWELRLEARMPSGPVFYTATVSLK